MLAKQQSPPRYMRGTPAVHANLQPHTVGRQALTNKLHCGWVVCIAHNCDGFVQDKPLGVPAKPTRGQGRMQRESGVGGRKAGRATLRLQYQHVQAAMPRMCCCTHGRKQIVKACKRVHRDHPQAGTLPARPTHLPGATLTTSPGAAAATAAAMLVYFCPGPTQSSCRVERQAG